MLCCRSSTKIFFFFQAEDGIRDVAVTGVQTCALPISSTPRQRPWPAWTQRRLCPPRHATGSLYGKTKRRRQRTVPKSPRKYEKTKPEKDPAVRLPLPRAKPAPLPGPSHRSEVPPITEQPHRDPSSPENA